LMTLIGDMATVVLLRQSGPGTLALLIVGGAVGRMHDLGEHARAQVAERRRAEEALRQAEARYRELYEHASDILYSHDLQGTLTAINATAEQLTGYAREEVIGQTVARFVAPESLPRVQQELARKRAGADDFRPYEIDLLRKDGSRLPVEVNTRLVYAAGRAVAVEGIARDVTERRRAAEALRASEERLRTVVTNAPVILFAVDREGVFTLSEGKGLEPLGGRPGEVIGRSIFELYANYPGIVDCVRRALSGEACSGTTAVGGVTFETWYAPLHSERGEIGRVIGVATDVTARQAYEDLLAHQAYHDPLTGLPNRAHFLDRADHALAHARRHDEAIAVLFLDLDRFKVVNDTLGHDTGDRLLVAATRRLLNCVRPEDTVARLGGDEFTILLEGITGVADATRVAERVVEALREPFRLGDREAVVTASIGIALGGAGQGRRHTAGDLLREADVAMYQAKGRGKARYAVFDASLGASTLERLSLEGELWRALECEEFRVYYQPKVQLATGRVIGLEALVRWEHPRRGLLAPAEFIPLAEETGMIRQLSRWVLETACRQAQAWDEQRREAAGPPLVVYVNLSARQFQQAELAEEVAGVLFDTGLAPDLLGLEITESAVIADTDAALGTLRRLHELGVRLAIDDFGAGYSGLGYLKRFPVDTLKIDKSLVLGLGRPEDGQDAAIVQAVIALARALGIQVTAEGVEDAEQLARLRELGCELGQGYYFAPPLPAEAVDALLLTPTAGSPSLRGSDAVLAAAD
jgi:diguanylate cyclase (GGDEF)-like protein/PAS domain S-box-containing protein